MTSYPYWVTSSQLGDFSEGHSFTENPLTIYFGESETTTSSLLVTLLNGSLPSGINWGQTTTSVVLTGVLPTVSSNEIYEWTFRVSNGTYVSDRTFFISVINQTVTQFFWETDNSTPLLYVYEAADVTASVNAISDPLQATTYNIENLGSLTQGIIIDNQTGIISINLSWKYLVTYNSGQDYVINNDRLYLCAISGISSSTSGPSALGNGIVDTNYPAWLPNRYYTLNSVVYNDSGKLYLCVQIGYSGSSGPTGTTSGISDGTCVWNYVGQAPVWNQITPDTSITLNLNLLASISSQSISKIYQAAILSRPYKPIWITPPGMLPSAYSEVSYSHQLDAFDPDFLALSWQGIGLPSWLKLSNIGLLYGDAPFVQTSITSNFSVAVSDGTSSVTRIFSLTVTEQIIEFYWEFTGNLGIMPDGAFCGKRVTATTIRRGATVSYGLSGGMLPVGVILNQSTGYLEGFVEYHAQNKLYMFEITATDGIETLVGEFTITVESQNQGHFWTLSVPLLGTTKEQFNINNGEGIVPYPDLFLPDQEGWGRNQNPKITIISGIRDINAQDLRTLISNYCHNFQIRLQNFEVMDGSSNNWKVLALLGRDTDSVSPWQANTVYKKGARVTNPDGYRYIALSSGTSGNIAIRGTNTNILDGTMSWAWDGNPNSNTSVGWPLPWYPYHNYYTGSIIVNNGRLLQSLNNGISGGDAPMPLGKPTGSIISDNQISWRIIDRSTQTGSGNQFWPSNVFNIRNLLINSVGWSNSWGNNATLVATVGFSGSILGVSILSSGTGYYNPPVYNISGGGSGGLLDLKVGIVSVNIINGGNSFTVGEQINIDFGNGSTAIIRVSTIDLYGSVESFDVVETGIFSRVPTGPHTLVSLGRLIIVEYIAGITQVQVVSGGSGYNQSNTAIDLLGREFSPTTDSTIINYNLMLPLARINSNASSSFDLSKYNPFNGQIIEAGVLEATVQGVNWAGYARLDADSTTFDEGNTKMVDINSATETIFDNNYTTWEQNTTTWDTNVVTWPNWSSTVFDSNHTIFDYYNTLFDQIKPPTSSKYSKTWLWWFGQPYSNN